MTIPPIAKRLVCMAVLGALLKIIEKKYNKGRSVSWALCCTTLAVLIGNGEAVEASLFLLTWIITRHGRRNSDKRDLQKWIETAETETALEPDQRMIDPHHHLWDTQVDHKFDLPKIAKIIFQHTDLNPLPFSLKNTFGFRSALIPTYLHREILSDIHNTPNGKSHHKICGTVYIESGWHQKDPDCTSLGPVGEVQFALKQASLSTKSRVLCKAVIPHMDLSRGAEIEPALRYLKSVGVTGIRDSLAWVPKEASGNIHFPANNTEFRAREESFREGFKLLAKYGFSYDSWIFQFNIKMLAELAAEFPDVVIVCDHVGSPVGLPPYTAEGNFEIWKADIAKLAKFSNVRCKLSGLGMRTAGLKHDEKPVPPTSVELAKSWRPYITHCIAVFGPSRCMFASNFPVDKISGSYTAFFNAFKLIVKDRTTEEKDLMFYRVAYDTYKLEGKM